MSDSTFSEKHALALIDQTIKSVRQKLGQNGFIFLLWGWLILAGNLLSYASIYFNFQNYIGYIWTVIGLGGGLISFLYYAKREKNKGPSSQIEKYFTYVWSGVGLGAIVLYACIIWANEFMLITPFVLTLAGIATFISGRILKVPALVLGGISFWVGTALALCFQTEVQFLIGAGCMVTGYLIPRFVLKAKSKKG
jgi:hypothetical protein